MSKSRIVIIEGMSTSGKTTLMTLVSEILKGRGLNCQGFEERQTMSRSIFSHFDPQLSLREMREFLEKECSSPNKIVVCDRFHFSHLAITNASAEDFQAMEEDILRHDPLLVLLEIPEDQVKERLLHARGHRSPYWEEELSQRGKTMDETVGWFTETQRNFQRLFENSRLPKMQLDTGKGNFAELARLIAEQIAPGAVSQENAQRQTE